MQEQTSTVPERSKLLAVNSSAETLSIRTARCGRTVWLQLRGILNWRTADQFRRAVDAELAAGFPPSKRFSRRLIIDLTEVEYVGGNGLRALVDLRDRLVDLGAELRLVAPEGSRCARTLALAGLDRVIPTFPSRFQAWRHGHRELGVRTRERETGAERPTCAGPAALALA